MRDPSFPIYPLSVYGPVSAAKKARFVSGKAPSSVVKARTSAEELNNPPDPFDLDRLALVGHVEADAALRPARATSAPATWATTHMPYESIFARNGPLLNRALP